MKRALLLVPTLALGLAATPALAQEAAADAEEAPRYPPSSVRPKLIAGGLAVTAIAYGVGYVAATSWPDAPGADALKIPVAGPWIAIAQNKCGDPKETDCSGAIWLRGLLTGLGGLAQLGGLGLVAEGIFTKTQAPAPKPDESATAIVVHPFPIVTAHSTGIGVVGTF
jgi:hypothetical protein